MSAAEPPGRLGRQVAISALYAVLQRTLLRFLGLFSTLILVRLLAPDDFGIVALASSVYVVLDVLTLTGFGMALVRMRDPQTWHYDTVFTLSLIRGALLSVAVVALAGTQADFMGDPRIEPVMWVIASSVMIGAFESVRIIDLHRSLRFDRLLHYNVVSKVLGIAISLPIAFWLQDYWALVLGGPISRLVTIPYSYRIAPYRPRLTLKAWRELFGFSKWLMLGNVCTVVDAQLMNLLIGRLQGLAAVGLYQVGYQIAALPITEIAAPIRSPLYAGFSRVHEEIAELRRQFMNGLELQWLIILPLSVGLALTSREVTLIFLGEKWIALAPLMPLIALFGLLDAFSVYAQMIFIVLNRQGPMVLSYFVLIGLRAAAVIYGAATGGIVGAATAMLVTAALNLATWHVQMHPLIGLRWRMLLAALWRGGVAAAAMCAVLLLALAPAIAGWPVAVILAAKAALGAAIYVAVVLGLWWMCGMPAQSAEAHVARAVGAAFTRVAGAVQQGRRAA